MFTFVKKCLFAAKPIYHVLQIFDNSLEVYFPITIEVELLEDLVNSFLTQIASNDVSKVRRYRPVTAEETAQKTRQKQPCEGCVGGGEINTSSNER